jgi:hydrogenase maturation protein HypF
MELHCYRILGIVQGVGFRPFIHKLASKYMLNGWILNDSDGVLLEVEGNVEELKKFIDEIKRNPPTMAKIEGILRISTNKKPGSYSGFEIRQSRKLDRTRTLIPPDSYVCDDCLNELFTKSDRRYKYPFINCTNCGPRYSIIEEMPYDRSKTTMNKFKMCPQCESEYHDIGNRRYHAQPNACPVCGPKLELRDKNGVIIETDDIIEYSIEKLIEGKIFAVKSIGGFHLVVDAKNDTAVKLLRKRKKRDSKPFALMLRDIESVHSYAYLCEEESKLLNSNQRPIVILKKKLGSLPDSIAPNNPSYGIMLPSAPLHYLLLSDKRLSVLVMTSGNISGNPIVYKNDEAIQQLASVADYFILNNRDIYTRVDDSIVRCTNHPDLDKTIVSYIRRSRGFAPYPIKVHCDLKSISALGPELKSTIALSKNNEVFISQHIGDVKNDETFSSLLSCSKHMKSLLSIKPEIIACDSHPLFRTTVASKAQNDLNVTLTQHHHSHMASCMAENKIDTTAIGVIFDGTGYGLDGTIWGGEFLIGDYSTFKRVGSLVPFYLLGGDKAVKEPFRVAIDLLYRTYEDCMLDLPIAFLSKLSEQESKVYHKMSKSKINSFQTTSMGRLFDGVSALIGVCSKIEYEGQAAIELESLLDRNFSLDRSFNYEFIVKDEEFHVDYRPLIKDIVNILVESNYDIGVLSRRFHSTIVDIVKNMCVKLRDKYNINCVVLSGGVFMNEYLLLNSILELRKLDFQVAYHRLVPANDGGISLGQIMIANFNERQCIH